MKEIIHNIGIGGHKNDVIAALVICKYVTPEEILL